MLSDLFFFPYSPQKFPINFLIERGGYISEVCRSWEIEQEEERPEGGFLFEKPAECDNIYSGRVSI